jgi:hypothetical protein
MPTEQLEERKLEAEINKIRAETELLRRHKWLSATEFIKVAGAIIATFAGLYAAITTYRITQLETRIAIGEREHAQKERQLAIAQLKVVRGELAKVNEAKLQVEQDLTTLLGRLDDVQGELSAAAKAPLDFGVLSLARDDLKAASQDAGRSLPYVLVVPATSGQGNVASKAVQILSAGGVRGGVHIPLKNVKNAPLVMEVQFFKSADIEEANRIKSLLVGHGFKQTKVSFANRPDIGRYRYYELRLPVAAKLP